MTERITSIEATMSDEQARRLKEFMLFRPIFNDKTLHDLNSILGEMEQSKARMKVCQKCSCFTATAVCTHYVWADTRWVAVGFTVENCGFWDRLLGCLFGWLFQ